MKVSRHRLDLRGFRLLDYRMKKKSIYVSHE